MLAAYRAGGHALLVAPTGAGKTLAGFLATLADLTEQPGNGLHTLYISPLKALAVDVRRNLLTPIEEMGLDIRVETRTGDTPSDRKARQRARPPQILLTTPESLSLLLSYPDSFQMFAGLKRVVIDEVHAFATGKRGDLLNLALARLQAIAPAMRRAALSAMVHLDSVPEDLLPAIVTCLDDPKQRENARLVLERVAGPSVLAPLAAHADNEVARWAIERLTKHLGETVALAALRAALHDNRRASVRIAALDEFIRLAADGFAEDRAAAAMRLGDTGPMSPAIGSAISWLLRSDNQEVRAAAVRAASIRSLAECGGE